jgi:Lactate racemase N-terminal domain
MPAMLSPTFPAVHLPHLEDVPIPPMLRLRLIHPKGGPIADVAGAVDEALAGSRRFADLHRGASVAVAVGSRGIAHIPEVVAAAVRHLKQRGFAPFIVPAMGSHGGATAEGQAGVLAHLGVTEATVGAPIRATMETVEYGATLNGIPCRFDKNAAEADAVLCINRVKAHTSFDRPIESGLTKLIAVGLGKQAGAQNVHRLGPRGYTEVLPALARIAIEHTPIAFGIALVENADKELVVIEGVEPDAFAATDERLLKLAKSLAPHLPFEQLDGLIVELIGKEISGAGMDPAVVGRVGIRSVPDPGKPFVNKLAVLGVTEDSYGNAVGLGNADYTTRKVANGVDLLPMYMNSITAGGTEGARMPAVLPDERTVLQAMVATCWRSDLENVRFCQIRSTLHLHEILITPALLPELEGRPDVARLSDPAPLQFSAAGELLTRV